MQDLSFLSNNFIYFPLPYRQVGRYYQKKLAVGTITFSSSTSIPYGLYARLALVALTNLAYRSQGKDIVAFSLYKLLFQLRENKPTGIQLDKFEEQLQNWATCLISVQYKDSQKLAISNLLLIEAAEFSLKKHLEKDSNTLIRFSERGKDFLINSAIPVPSSAIKTITQPFDFDTLMWLISSIYQIQEQDYKIVKWNHLFAQFNIAPKNSTRFKSQFSETLFTMRQAYYPDAEIYRDPEGIRICKSPLLVKQKDSILIPDFEPGGIK